MANRDKVMGECNWAIDQITVNGFTTLMTKGFFRDVITLLKEQPEIIHCKDCKYWIGGGIDDKDNFIPPMCKWFNTPKHADWYCADGRERNETAERFDKGITPGIKPNCSASKKV